MIDPSGEVREGGLHHRMIGLAWQQASPVSMATTDLLGLIVHSG